MLVLVKCYDNKMVKVTPHLFHPALGSKPTKKNTVLLKKTGGGGWERVLVGTAASLCHVLPGPTHVKTIVYLLSKSKEIFLKIAKIIRLNQSSVQQ